jgi:urea ABC transporter permease protein UrtC
VTLTRWVTGRRIGGVILLIAAVFPWTVNPFEVSLVAKTLTFAMLAVSLDLIWGVAGILSFGHAAFFGVGAYAVGLITRDNAGAGAGLLGLLVAIGLAALLALALGYFTFYGGVSGAYFAIITLAVSLMLTQLAQTWVGLTGGHNGLYPVPFLTLGIPGIAEFTFDTDIRIYYLTLALLILVFLLSRAVIRSGFGQALVAMESDESRVRFLGYDTRRLKLLVFTLSGAIAGMAGGLYAPMVGFVNPGILGLLLSTQVIIWVALGGRGTLVGPIVGALAIAFLEDYLSGTFVNVWLLVLGLLVLLIALFRPQGLLGGQTVRRLTGVG